MDLIFKINNVVPVMLQYKGKLIFPGQKMEKTVFSSANVFFLSKIKHCKLCWSAKGLELTMAQF